MAPQMARIWGPRSTSGVVSVVVKDMVEEEEEKEETDWIVGFFFCIWAAAALCEVPSSRKSGDRHGRWTS